MTGETADYEVVSDFPQRCAAIISVNPERYRSVRPALLRMVIIGNREPPVNGPHFRVVRVNDQISQFCPFRYVILIWHLHWDQLDEDGRTRLIAGVLDDQLAKT